MSIKNRLVMGSAIGLATIAVAIDHTRHTLPEAESYQSVIQGQQDSASPCSLESPCSLDSASPCSLDGDSVSPCSM